MRAPRCRQTLWKPPREPSFLRVMTMVSPWPSQTTWSPTFSSCSERHMICQLGLSTYLRSSSKRSGSVYQLDGIVSD